MNARTWALPALASALVAVVLGIQISGGGGEFEPLAPVDPCAERTVTSTAEGLDNLTERLVLLGLDGAGCRLGLTREALTLQLAQPGARSEVEVEAQTAALRAGLLDAVRRMEREDSLPPISALVDEALENADLNRFLEAAIRRLPDSVIDAALKTDDVLTRAIEDLDLRSILENLEDPRALNREMNTAVERAVKDALVDRLRDLLP